MKIERILVSVAGRGLCEETVNQLLEMPAFQQAKVTVLHVVPPEVSAEAVPEKLEEAGKILAEAVRKMKVDPALVNPRLLQGDPKAIVPEVADEEDADLIVMGSRGLAGLRAILENSVSQYVFQLTKRPMLLVKDDIYVRRLNRVMVAMDKSDSAIEAVRTAAAFVRQLKGSQLLLAHVTSGGSADAVDGPPETDPVLAPAIAEAKRAGVDYRCLVSTGKAGEEICRLADENNADLLVIGSPDRRPSIAKALVDLDKLVGGSLSDYVRVHAQCPVLLVRQSAA